MDLLDDAPCLLQDHALTQMDLPKRGREGGQHRFRKAGEEEIF